MFDSLKKIISQISKKDDVEVYVEIPLDDFKQEQEEKRKKEDLGLKIPTRLESFLDLKKEISEEEEKQIEIPKKIKEDKEKNILLVGFSEVQKQNKKNLSLEEAFSISDNELNQKLFPNQDQKFEFDKNNKKENNLDQIKEKVIKLLPAELEKKEKIENLINFEVKKETLINNNNLKKENSIISFFKKLFSKNNKVQKETEKEKVIKLLPAEPEKKDYIKDFVDFEIPKIQKPEKKNDIESILPELKIMPKNEFKEYLSVLEEKKFLKEKEERDRLEKEKIKQESLLKQKLEEEKKLKEKEILEQKLKEKEERDRLEKEKIKQESLLKQKLEEEKKLKEKEILEQKLKEKEERDRLEKEKLLIKKEIIKKDIKEKTLGIQSDINFVFKSFAYFFGSICFISLSIYLFYFSENTLKSAENVLLENISLGKPVGIRYDQNINISLDPNQNKQQINSNIIQFLLNQEIKFGSLITLNPEYLQETKEGEKVLTYKNPLRGDEFLFIFMPSASLAFRTIAATENKIGAVNIASQNELFLSLNVDNSAVAYREILFYEKFMYDDLKKVFNFREPVGKVYFKDASVNNHILRAMIDDDGILLVYGFADIRTIVFAPNVAVFEKVYERLR